MAAKWFNYCLGLFFPKKKSNKLAVKENLLLIHQYTFYADCIILQVGAWTAGGEVPPVTSLTFVPSKKMALLMNECNETWNLKKNLHKFSARLCPFFLETEKNFATFDTFGFSWPPTPTTAINLEKHGIKLNKAGAGQRAVLDFLQGAARSSWWETAEISAFKNSLVHSLL